GFVRVDLGVVAMTAGDVFEVRAAAATGETAPDFVLVKSGGGSVSGIPPPSVAPVTLPPFRLIGAVQDFVLDRYGLGVSYLFNRPPDKNASQRAASYSVRSTFHGQDTASPAQVVDHVATKSGASAFYQESSERVVDVRFTSAPSPLAGVFEGQPILRHQHLLDTAALVDTHGGALDAATPPLTLEPNHVGGLVDGKVVRGTGDPVSGATVRLLRQRSVCPDVGFEAALGECHDVLEVVGEVVTGADGAFYFDFIESPPADASIKLPYILRATVPAGADPNVNPAEVAEVSSVIRLQDRIQHVSIALLGRGTVTGKLVYKSDGSPVAGGAVSATNGIFGETKTTKAGADGSFLLGGVPVGPVTVVGSDAAGNRVYATLGLDHAGDVKDVRLELEKKVQRTGSVVGTVVTKDAAGSLTPVSGATVAIYPNGALFGQKTTDATGTFRFDRVPEGPATLQAARFAVSRTAALASVLVAADQTVTQTLTLVTSKPRSVVGRVLFHDAATNTDVSVGGATISTSIPGLATFTAADGTYRLDGVPVQGAGEAAYVVNAIDYARGLQGDTSLPPVLDVGDDTPLAAPTIFLRGMTGSVTGVVLDPLGKPVAGAGVVLYAIAETTTDGSGRFSFEDVPIGKYPVIAHSGDGLQTGRVGWFGEMDVQILFAGHHPTAVVQMRGGGVARIKTRTSTSTGVLSPIYYNPTYFSDTEKRIIQKVAAIKTTTSENGDLEIPMPVGTFVLTATNPFHGEKRVGGAIDYPGQIRSFDVVFDDTSRLTGRVLDVDGITPVPGADVTLSIKDFLPQTKKADASGSFSFSAIPLGAVWVTADATVGAVERVG
ncbi:MAG TPA: carboxypeptidase-like regulatory domain-containing protein, partial [Thermoanaerobaculia bacterium]|nr:carboxypeptidase-like regulatory domain-containing protein [Thermoanaerobaculia bacterium]